MKRSTVSERVLVLAPRGRDAAIAAGMMTEAGIESTVCPSLAELVAELDRGAGFVLVTEEALVSADLHPLSAWIDDQEKWSDLPFILLTNRGGGLERNPAARRFLAVLGNVTFVERPFHPTTLVSLAQAALRGRRRQYEARARLVSLREREAELAEAAETLKGKVAQAVDDREMAMAQLHEAQKLETIGQLTGGVAHDFNNLLTPITGALDLLNHRYAEADPRTGRLIDNALQSAERAKLLISRLLGFARRTSLESRSVDTAQLVEGMRDLIASSVSATVELKLLTVADVPPALADPNQLELAILNLCVNARDAMEGGGVLTITVERAVVGPRAMPDLVPGVYVRLSVIDTGKGMDEDTLKRAVEPFYSTKGVGKGTGLGLSMVHGLAAQLGGAFALTSALGEGTRADLYLPVTEAAAEKAPRSVSCNVRALQPRTLLLVDDEELVRTGTAEMLREIGHTVHEAAGGAQALGKLGAGLRVDAMITDYMMPRMNGAELARRVRELHPDMPVLVVTGYAGGDLDIGLPQLAKPFRQVDIAAAIEMLTGPTDNVVRMPRLSR